MLFGYWIFAAYYEISCGIQSDVENELQWNTMVTSGYVL